MKKTLSKFIQPAIAVVALVLVVSAASAWTQPTQAPTGGNVWAPLNTGPNAQTKSGNLWSDQSIFAGTNLAAGDSAYITNLITAAKGRFGCPNVFGCTGDTASNILNAGFHNPVTATMTKGIAVDLDGSFYVKDGNQGAAKVLTSDASGQATWQTPAAQTAQAEIEKIPLYSKNPACSASDTNGGGTSTKDRCYADACVKFNGSPATSFYRPYATCVAVSGGQFSMNGLVTPYQCKSGNGNPPAVPHTGDNGVGALSGMATSNSRIECDNVQIGYYVGNGAPTQNPQGYTWTPVTGQGTDGQTCAAWLGVPGNQARIQLKIGTTVMFTDQCIYTNGSSTQRHDATWSSSGWYPKSPASMTGQVYMTEKAI